MDVNLLGRQGTTSDLQAKLLAQTGDRQVLGNLLNPGSSLNLLAVLNALSQ